MVSILVFIDWFLPGYKAGGQIPSVRNLVKSFSRQHDFYILTSDRDLGDAQPYHGVETGKWLAKEGYKIYYKEVNQINELFLIDLIKAIDPDTIYLNSFFSRKFTLLPLEVVQNYLPDKKVVLAPRGMLGAGALAQKAVKKKLFLKYAKAKGLYNNLTWQASSINEKQEIEKIFGRQKIIVASDIPNIPSATPPQKPVKKTGTARFFFLSRISPKKNLLGALQLLQRLKPDYNITFSIIGPLEDAAYWQKCQKTMNELPANIKVEAEGEIPGPQIPNHLADNFHYFLFPTLHENFGHVIHESLAAGCPVIISDQTPWQDLQQKGIGWDIPLADTEGFTHAIKTCLAMDQATYIKMSKAAHTYAQQVATDPAILEANKKLFE